MILTHSKGKETHYYFLQALGNGKFRESQHFIKPKLARKAEKEKYLVWQINNGENSCSGCN